MFCCMKAVPKGSCERESSDNVGMLRWGNRMTFSCVGIPLVSHPVRSCSGQGEYGLCLEQETAWEH